MNSVHIREATHEDLAELFTLLSGNGWSHRFRDEEQLGALLAASQRKVVADIDGRIVGFARAITDGISNGYISMVVVAQAHRGQGIGRAVVERLLEGSPGVTWVLRAGRSGAPEFFSALGFAHSAEAMELKRSKSAA